MLHKFTINTEQEEMINITKQVYEALKSSGLKNGFCLVYCPHTTAAITINENTDPHVKTDILHSLKQAFPDRGDFKHIEGNSAAHVKSSVVGPCITLPVEDGHLRLGRWQAVYFCEFDGPRARNFLVSFSRGI